MATAQRDTGVSPASSVGNGPRGTGVALRDPLPWEDLVQVVRTAEQTGYAACFLPEIAGRDAFVTLAGLAATTQDLLLGSGVASIRSRKLSATAMAAATVHELSAGRLVLGLGAGPPGPGSLDHARAAVEAMRSAFAGRPFRTEEGEEFQLGLQVPSSPPVWLAGLGDRMIALAGEIADGVLLNWCTPGRVARARELVADGAERAGRDPRGVSVGVYVRACLGHEDEVALVALGQATVQYASIPHYRRQMEGMGLGEEAARAAATGKATELLVRELCILGPTGSAARRLDEYRAAGADVPVVYPVAAREQASSIMGTVLALAPSPALEP